MGTDVTTSTGRILLLFICVQNILACATYGCTYTHMTGGNSGIIICLFRVFEYLDSTTCSSLLRLFNIIFIQHSLWS